LLYNCPTLAPAECSAAPHAYMCANRLQEFKRTFPGEAKVIVVSSAPFSERIV